MTDAEQADPLAAFAAAFNARDLEALKDLLDEGATAVVLDAPFPEERGPDQIAATSLTHMLGDGTDPLAAEVFRQEEEALVLFLARTEPPAVDSAARVTTEGDRIRRLEYVVTWHRPAQLAAIARARGLDVRATP